MTSRTRNLSILGVVVALLVLALLVILPGSPLSKDTKLGLDLEGGIELVYEARPDPAGAAGHPTGHRRRDRDDAQARGLARRVRAGDPALGPRADRRRACPRPERRARQGSGRHHRAAPVLRLGAQPPHRAARPTPAATPSTTPPRRPRSRRARPSGWTSSPGSGDTPEEADRKNNTANDRYYLFGPDQLPIGPGQRAGANGQLRAVGLLQGAAGRLPGRGRAAPGSTRRTPSACRARGARRRAGRPPARG